MVTSCHRNRKGHSVLLALCEENPPATGGVISDAELWRIRCFFARTIIEWLIELPVILNPSRLYDTIVMPCFDMVHLKVCFKVPLINRYCGYFPQYIYCIWQYYCNNSWYWNFAKYRIGHHIVVFRLIRTWHLWPVGPLSFGTAFVKLA